MRELPSLDPLAISCLRRAVGRGDLATWRHYSKHRSRRPIAGGGDRVWQLSGCLGRGNYTYFSFFAAFINTSNCFGYESSISIITPPKPPLVI